MSSMEISSIDKISPYSNLIFLLLTLLITSAGVFTYNSGILLVLGMQRISSHGPGANGLATTG